MTMKQEDDFYEIPIKVDSYESIFNEFDYSPMENRELKDEIDSFIDTALSKSDKKIRNSNIELILYLPLKVEDKNEEKRVINGLINYYKSNLDYQKKLKAHGLKRIGYYIVTALLLFTCWYYVLKFGSEGFLTSILNAGGTVLLWEIMSLVFIERKNAKDRRMINRKLSNMKIKFQYI